MTTVSSFTTAAGFKKKRKTAHSTAFGYCRLHAAVGCCWVETTLGEFVLQRHFQMMPARWAPTS